MPACTFFGHRECCGLDTSVLQIALESLIAKGVDTFYVGNQGQFGSMVLGCLKRLKKIYAHIQFSVVLAYPPTQKPEYDLYAACSIYPEGLELGLPKFAVERRNRWMMGQSDYCLCYVNHSWGGAYKFACLAKRRGLTVINVGDLPI